LSAASLVAADCGSAALARGSIPALGKRKLRELTVEDVEKLLSDKSAVLSTRSLRIIHPILSRSVRRAQVRDAYPPIPPNMALVRSVRAGGDTKTRKSRRALILPQRAVDALQVLWEKRTCGHAEIPEYSCLVFVTRTGRPLEARNVRRDFRRVVDAAGLVGREWAPRELRHSFVSLLSDAGVPIETLSRLVCHRSTRSPRPSTASSWGRWSKAAPRSWTSSSQRGRVPSSSHSVSHSDDQPGWSTQHVCAGGRRWVRTTGPSLVRRVLFR
jgi:hypothetical protein